MEETVTISLKTYEDMKQNLVDLKLLCKDVTSKYDNDLESLKIKDPVVVVLHNWAGVKQVIHSRESLTEVYSKQVKELTDRSEFLNDEVDRLTRELEQSNRKWWQKK